MYQVGQKVRLLVDEYCFDRGEILTVIEVDTDDEESPILVTDANETEKCWPDVGEFEIVETPQLPIIKKRTMTNTQTSKYQVGQKIKVLEDNEGLREGGIYEITSLDLDDKEHPIQVKDQVLGGWPKVGTFELLDTPTPETKSIDDYSIEELEAAIEKKKEGRYLYRSFDGDIESVGLDKDGDLIVYSVKPEDIRQLIQALTNYADDHNL